MLAPECLKPPFLGPTCPGLKPPPGVIPNFDNPSSQRDVNLLCQVVCLAVTSACVAIRMYTRLYITRNHGLEDYACFFAWCGLLVYCGLQLTPLFVNFAGVHQWNIMQKDLVNWVQLANVIEIIYNPIIFATKLSILLLFLRIFVPNGKGPTYYIIHVLIWLNLCFYVANVPIEIWPCIPREKLWKPSLPGHCLNNERVFVAGGAINVVSDFAILLLPMVLISRLHMPLRKKIGVSAIFATGFLQVPQETLWKGRMLMLLSGVVASIMHLVTSVQASHSADKSYTLFPLALWTVAEIASGITCGSLLTIPHFFRHFAPMIASKLTFTRSSQSGSNRRSRASARNRLASLVPARRTTKAAPQWHDHYDTTTNSTTITTKPRRESYLELNSSKDWRGPTTEITGERHHGLVDEEAGIVKTVRVEQFPEQKVGAVVSHRAVSE